MVIKRILHVHDVSNVASNFVTGQRKLGIDAEIFPITKLKPDSKIIDSFTIPFKKLRDAVKLKLYVQTNHFDIVHVHFASQAWIALIMGIPYYLHIHGSDARRFLHTAGYGQLIRIGIKKAIKIFYVTPELKNHIQAVRHDGLFLPNPINTELFRPYSSNRKLSVSVLCISKMDRYKGLEDLFETIEMIWTARPGVTIGILGFGNLMQVAQPFFDKHKNNPNLRIISRTPYAEMPDLINSYDLVLGHQCTEYGSLSCSELEAMSCEKPVVVRFLYPEAYPEQPPVSVSRSAEEAATNIIDLLNNQIYAQTLGSAARGWVRKYHEQDLIVRKLLDYYQ